VPVELRYDPVTNPTSARGTFWHGLVNLFGIDKHTGFAPSAYGNVGVQYALRALNDGDITKGERVPIYQALEEQYIPDARQRHLASDGFRESV